jgi:beta-lactamase class A
VDYDLGVYVQDILHLRIVLDCFSDQVFPTASVLKVPILVELYRQIIETDFDPDATLQVQKASEPTVAVF